MVGATETGWGWLDFGDVVGLGSRREGQEEGSGGGEATSGLLLGGMLTASTPCIQDVDSRDRRRRELEQPEQQEHPEQPEPSTSWWPVSSAEKKKNITLVRAGQTWYSGNEGQGCWCCDGMLGDMEL